MIDLTDDDMAKACVRFLLDKGYMTLQPADPPGRWVIAYVDSDVCP